MRADLRLIVSVQAVRAFAYGFGAVLLGSILARAGLSDTQVGLVFGAMLGGMGLMTLVVALGADGFGRRRAYVLLLAVMGVAGGVFALTTWLPALIVAALTGTLSTDANESGPISSLEQGMMGQAEAGDRAAVFGRYNSIAFLFGSFGALAAGGPAALRHLLPSLPANQLFLLVFPLAGLACALVAGRLSPAVDAAVGTGGRPAGLRESRRQVGLLAALNGVDSFASGFVVQAFLVFWFSRRFGIRPELMGLLFFATGILQAFSALAGGWLGTRVGLLRTMIGSHVPANLCLAAIPLAPVFPVAAALLLVRSALSNMDTPARQAYTQAIVRPEERAAAASYTNVVRYFAKPIGPIAGGALMHLSFGAPLVVAGLVKVGYDAVLYATFRRVRLAG